METLICGAWHNQLVLSNALAHPESRRRIFARHPDRDKAAEYCPTGVDSQQVFNGQSWVATYAFLHTLSNDTQIITLTKKEKELLLTSGLISPTRLYSFEEIYPFYSKIIFVNNAEKNYRVLLRLLADVSKLNIHGRATDYYAKKFLYKVARKVKYRCSLDAYFAHASLSPYQETFKLIEARPERTIIALDFNSMYGDCLRGPFADPAHLVTAVFNRPYDASVGLACGLYRVRLAQPTGDFIRHYHGLKFAFLNKKYAFWLTADQQIETLLHSNEIEYYARHFLDIYLLDGVISQPSIQHPLLQDAERIYAQRQHYKKQGNEKLARLCKLQIATLHSVVKRRQYQEVQFKDYASALRFLEQTFGLALPPGMAPLAFLTSLSDGVKFTINIVSDISIKYLTHHSDSLVFSLFSQVIANARVKMMQTLEFLLQFPGVEICYCNIDSIHLSLPESQRRDFYHYAAPLIGPELGKLKVESEASQGYWFEPGRYWLIKDNAVVQFKNQGLHNPWAAGLFQQSRAWYKIYREEGYSVPIKCRRQLATTLTYKKPLAETTKTSDVSFARYSAQQLASQTLIQQSILNEIRASSAYKLSLFHRLAARFDAPEQSLSHHETSSETPDIASVRII